MSADAEALSLVAVTRLKKIFRNGVTALDALDLAIRARARS